MQNLHHSASRVVLQNKNVSSHEGHLRVKLSMGRQIFLTYAVMSIKFTKFSFSLLKNAFKWRDDYCGIECRNK